MAFLCLKTLQSVKAWLLGLRSRFHLSNYNNKFGSICFNLQMRSETLALLNMYTYIGYQIHTRIIVMQAKRNRVEVHDLWQQS